TLRLAQQEVEARELDLITVVGKSEPVRIYELLGHTGQLAPGEVELANEFGKGNGRTCRLSLTKDKRWSLYRVNSTSDDEEGGFIGKYQRQGDATKVVKEMAYQPEPRW
ncbi:MAG: hypothetical protein ABWZ64_16000, partial [Xanthobacteraceae bacterium]